MSGSLNNRQADKVNISLRQLSDVRESNFDVTRVDTIEHNQILVSYNVLDRDKQFVFKKLSSLLEAGAGVELIDNDGVITIKVDTSGITVPTPTLDEVTTEGNTTTNTITVAAVTADYLLLNTSPTLPTPSQGMIYWDVDRQTVSIQLNGIAARLGQDNFWYVKNQSGAAINKGTAVMAVGTLGASSRILIDKMVADGSVSPKYLLGVTAETIADGNDGFVMNIGKIRQLDTSLYTDGDILYCDPATPGGFVNSMPQAPSLKLALAFVVYAASNGVIAVRANPGSDLYEDHRVEIGTLKNAQVLRYNSTNSRWENSGDFDFTLNFEAANPYTIILPYDFSIDSVDDPASITYTITVNASSYTLGTTITALDVVEVTPGAIGWLNLNCTRLS